MKKNSKVSVIVPIYNVENYLKACLESLVNQTLKEIEIICINDGSTDKSFGILKEYQKKDKRIKVINQKNQGRSAARNAGLKEVKSDYVMFCDADDRFSLTACEDMVRAIEKNNVDVVVCGVKMVYEAHEEMRGSDIYYYGLKYSGRRFINDEIIMGTNGSVCNKIFRMKSLKENEIKFPEKLGTAEDYYFYSVYMSVSKSIYFLNKKLYEYVRHEGSTMSSNFNKEKMSVDDLLVAEKIFEFYKKTGFLKSHKNLFWRQWAASFWASYRYSGKKYRDEVLNLGKEFISKNYNSNRPTDRRIERIVQEIANYNLYYQVKQYVKNILRRFYTKVSFSYRQQNFIKLHLAAISDRYEGLSDRLDNIIKEGK